MNRICDIIYRLRRGQSERAIERDLGHSRNTIREYHKLAREKGYLGPDRPLPEPEEILAELGEPPTPPAIESTVEPYREAVEKPTTSPCLGKRVTNANLSRTSSRTEFRQGNESIRVTY